MIGCKWNQMPTKLHKEKKHMLTDCWFYTIQVFQAERTKYWQTPAEQSHWLVP